MTPRPSKEGAFPMQYLLLIYTSESTPPPGDVNAMMAEYGVLHSGHRQEHEALQGRRDRLQPTSTATTVRIRDDGKTLITDGPFAETREQARRLLPDRGGRTSTRPTPSPPRSPARATARSRCAPSIRWAEPRDPEARGGPMTSGEIGALFRRRGGPGPCDPDPPRGRLRPGRGVAAGRLRDRPEALAPRGRRPVPAPG